ncbi:1450_t:CDS:2 [Acaulospora colombiana]|uniref:1450_t:CDS:1 n=1 Tax=Acaulospora colombiana TaxID=27376 RepID=A0ACA9KM84_9GLOM|nr:1450_t:CDS:2 [Acaulospora colombiana]
MQGCLRVDGDIAPEWSIVELNVADDIEPYNMKLINTTVSKSEQYGNVVKDLYAVVIGQVFVGQEWNPVKPEQFVNGGGGKRNREKVQTFTPEAREDWEKAKLESQLSMPILLYTTMLDI